MLGNIKPLSSKFSKNNDSVVLSKLTNQAIQVLNRFLTKNQSNYRRWIKYIEENEMEKHYLEPIGKLQKEYPHYEELIVDFKKVNDFFTNEFAKTFDIDIEKWMNWEGELKSLI